MYDIQKRCLKLCANFTLEMEKKNKIVFSEGYFLVFFKKP